VCLHGGLGHIQIGRDLRIGGRPDVILTEDRSLLLRATRFRATAGRPKAADFLTSKRDQSLDGQPTSKVRIGRKFDPGSPDRGSKSPHWSEIGFSRTRSQLWRSHHRSPDGSASSPG
jgi:hypothetical protein